MLKRIMLIVGIIVAGLVGSGLLNAEEGSMSIESDNSEGLTDFHYLPLVTSFPPIWFVKSSGSPVYLQNYANNGGCNWAGIAGEVFDLQEDPVAPGEYRVHAWGSGIDERVPVGGAPGYGPSGYEIYLFDSPIMNDYDLQLETADGIAVSTIFGVQTRANCAENLLYFVFLQDY